MKMEISDDSVWRIAAKVVAVMDMIYSFLALVVFALVFLHGVEIESVVVSHKLEVSKTGGDSLQHLGFSINQLAIWGVIFIYGTIALVELYAANGLYKATKPEADIFQAFKLSLNWLLVQIGSVVLRAVFHFATGSFWVWILESYVRMAAIYVVFKETKELKEEIDLYIQVSGVTTSKTVAQEKTEKEDKMVTNVVFEV